MFTQASAIKSISDSECRKEGGRKYSSIEKQFLKTTLKFPVSVPRLNLVSLPYIAARKAGKCSLYSEWLSDQLNIKDRENKYGGTTK